MVERTRCKFVCESVEPNYPGDTALNVKLSARYETDSAVPEDERFSRYTPSGQLTAVINNPALEGFFVVGKHYYLDIVPADK